MKKFIFALLLMPFLSFAQTNFQIGYQHAFADAFCYNRESTCQRIAPYTSDIPSPNYAKNESSNNYMDGYINGIIAGFAYRNTKQGTRYDYGALMTQLLERKMESRRRQVQQTEDFYNQDLQRRHPRPTDPRQRAIYDAIMSNDL